MERRLLSARKSVELAEGLLKKARATRDKAALDAVTKGLMSRAEVAKALGVSRAFVTTVEGMPSSWSKQVTDTSDPTAA